MQHLNIEKRFSKEKLNQGIAVLPIDETDFQVYPIVSEVMKLLVHIDHPLSTKEVVHLKKLQNEKFIFYNEQFCFCMTLFGGKRINEGFEPKILFKSSQWDFMSEMVAANLGVTILPQSLCSRVDHHHIKILDLNPPTLWNLAVLPKMINMCRMPPERLSILFIQ